MRRLLVIAFALGLLAPVTAYAAGPVTSLTNTAQHHDDGYWCTTSSGLRYPCRH